MMTGGDKGGERLSARTRDMANAFRTLLPVVESQIAFPSAWLEGALEDLGWFGHEPFPLQYLFMLRYSVGVPERWFCPP